QVAPDPIPRKVSQKRPKGRSKRRRRRRSSRYLKAVQPYVRSTPNDSGGQNGERDVRSLAAHASTYPAALFATPTPSRPHIPRPPSHVPRPIRPQSTVHRLRPASERPSPPSPRIHVPEPGLRPGPPRRTATPPARNKSLSSLPRRRCISFKSSRLPLSCCLSIHAPDQTESCPSHTSHTAKPLLRIPSPRSNSS
ncbi:hypothetical protein CCUS01_17299, partial [Colletotrichum cuscutae]